MEIMKIYDVFQYILNKNKQFLYRSILSHIGKRFDSFKLGRKPSPLLSHPIYMRRGPPLPAPYSIVQGLVSVLTSYPFLLTHLLPSGHRPLIAYPHQRHFNSGNQNMHITIPKAEVENNIFSVMEREKGIWMLSNTNINKSVVNIKREIEYRHFNH